MKQIKFRGKVKSTNSEINKRWAYGGYCEIEDRCYIILDGAEFQKAAETIDGCIEDMIMGFVEVIPETVEQYIGDINGKEIYDTNVFCRTYLLNKFPYFIRHYETSNKKS